VKYLIPVASLMLTIPFFLLQGCDPLGSSDAEVQQDLRGAHPQLDTLEMKGYDLVPTETLEMQTLLIGGVSTSLVLDGEYTSYALAF